jgi:hypothetical protein
VVDFIVQSKFTSLRKLPIIPDYVKLPKDIFGLYPGNTSVGSQYCPVVIIHSVENINSPFAVDRGVDKVQGILSKNVAAWHVLLY